MNPAARKSMLERMDAVELKQVAARTHVAQGGCEQKLHSVLFALFLLNAGVVWMRSCAPEALFAGQSWPDAFLVVLATATTLASLSRQLPAQNVILAAAVIGVAAVGAAILAMAAGFSLGRPAYQPQNIGRPMFGVLPWSVPLIWVTVILNARGVGRLILARSRANDNYGFWLMGVTVLLVIAFELSFEPYATLVKQYWSWNAAGIHSDWYSTPWTSFLGCAAVAAVVLVLVTPVLINKRPIQLPPQFHPLIIWEVISFLLLTGAIHAGLWGAVWLMAAQMGGVGAAAVVGAQNSSPKAEARKEDRG